MRELISAAADAIVSSRRPILVVLGAVMLPALLLEKIPETVGGPTLLLGDLGAALDAVAATLLVALCLAGLRGSSQTTVGARSVLSATVRAVIALVIAYAPVLPIALIALEAMRSQPVVLRDLAFDAVLAPWFWVIAPVLLATPVCLNERGGPVWALKRAWSLSSPRRKQVRLLLMVVWIAGGALGLLRLLPGPLTLATLITTPAVAVAQAALVAVLYVRLREEEPVAPRDTVPVRSPLVAAQGTFRDDPRRRANSGRRRK